MKKRLLALCLSLSILLCGLAYVRPVHAAGTLLGAGKALTVSAGKTVEMELSITSNPGISYVAITVKLDPEITLTSVQNGSVLKDMDKGVNIIWSADSDSTATGVLAKLTFTVASDAPAKTYPVQFIVRECYNANMEDVVSNISSGSITVICPHNNKTNVPAVAATCKDTGYTAGVYCEDCDTYISGHSVVEKTNEHKYENCEKVNNITHKFTCTVCSKVITENHTWNSGTVTKPASCKETGENTYTCTGCNASKTETTDKLTTHTYGAWTKVSDTQHKHVCSVCQKEETANHSWDSGKVTKKATCKDTGIKTYTCTGCQTTKTEEIAMTTTHTYAKWTKVNDDQHKHVCTVCQKEETANHSWNSGAVTKKATCKDTGIKTFTCTGCSATKTQEIAKLTTHTYKNGCDPDCNVCGLTRTTSHKYASYWSKNQNGHWHTCTVCGDTKDFAGHTPGAAATETTAQTCTKCGYVIKAALGHTHSYATTWTTDETGHWYACTGCEEKYSAADHDFENACDPDCSVCGYTRETSHVFAETWATDVTNHWHECTGCGLKQDEAAHEPGAEATATTAQVCTICEYEIAPALGVEEPLPSEDDPADNTTIIIAVIAAVLVIGGIIAFVIIKKKKK